MRTQATLLLAALALAGCSPKFDGPEKIKGLRVLAVQAEPPEIGAAADAPQTSDPWPADSTALRTLVGHPGFADGTDDVHAVVVHLTCTSDPANLQGTTCTQISALSDPAEVFQHVSIDLAATCAGTATGKKEAVTLSGLEGCNRSGCSQLAVPPAAGEPGVPLPTPRYRLPGDLSLAGELAPGDPRRLLGTDVVDLAVAVDVANGVDDLMPATPVSATCEDVLQGALQRLQTLWTERPHLLALKWIHVRGPEMPKESPPNQNPQVEGIALGGKDLVALPTANEVPAGKEQSLQANAAQYDARPSYQRYDTDGRLVDTHTEDWAFSWFSTAGTIDELHTQSPHEKNTFSLGKGHQAMMWLVVRDLRGGEAWTAAAIDAP